MKTRLVILFIMGILIVAVTVFSVFYYKQGRDDQYDEYILKYSKLEGEPGLKPVDPAIVKAIISVRTNFSPPPIGPNGEKGLMFVPEEGVEKFKDYHGKGDVVIVTPENEKKFGYICPNRHFPNHKKPYKVDARAGRCLVCSRRTVEAIIDPDVNIRIGTWYLAYVTAYLKENIEGIDEGKLLDYTIEAYRLGLETFEKVTRDLTDFRQLDELRADIDKIKKEAERFRPRLEKKAHIIERN